MTTGGREDPDILPSWNKDACRLNGGVREVYLYMFYPSVDLARFCHDLTDDAELWTHRNIVPTVMKTNVVEKEGSYHMDIEMPGFDRDDIRIELEKGDLFISADHSGTHEEKDAKSRVIHRERYSGRCSRHYYVDEALQPEDVKASFKDGILHIEFPAEKKQKETKKQLIKIG